MFSLIVAMFGVAITAIGIQIVRLKRAPISADSDSDTVIYGLPAVLLGIATTAFGIYLVVTSLRLFLHSLD